MSFSLWTVDLSSVHVGASALGLPLFDGKSHENPGRGILCATFGKEARLGRTWTPLSLRLPTFPTPVATMSVL
jgi:hypothetical protein